MTGLPKPDHEKGPGYLTGNPGLKFSPRECGRATGSCPDTLNRFRSQQVRVRRAAVAAFRLAKLPAYLVASHS
jgi:hypothetical protein